MPFHYFEVRMIQDWLEAEALHVVHIIYSVGKFNQNITIRIKSI